MSGWGNCSSPYSESPDSVPPRHIRVVFGGGDAGVGDERKNPCYSVNPSGPTPFPLDPISTLARESVEDFCQDLHPDPISRRAQIVGPLPIHVPILRKIRRDRLRGGRGTERQDGDGNEKAGKPRTQARCWKNRFHRRSGLAGMVLSRRRLFG